MEEKQECLNCAHFVQHYRKDAVNLMAVCCGQCRARKLTKREYISFPFISGCDQWAPKTPKPKIDEEPLREVLLRLHARVEELYLILSAEELK